MTVIAFFKPRTDRGKRENCWLVEPCKRPSYANVTPNSAVSVTNIPILFRGLAAPFTLDDILQLKLKVMKGIRKEGE